jgi:hypothetical protein
VQQTAAQSLHKTTGVLVRMENRATPAADMPAAANPHAQTHMSGSCCNALLLGFDLLCLSLLWLHTSPHVRLWLCIKQLTAARLWPC